MEFGVLGPLLVRGEGGQVITPSAPVLRQLLATLLSRAGGTVLTGDLAGSVWHGDSPPHARKTLQVYVHRLRQLISPERVVREPAGYRLLLAPGELDAERLIDLVDRARAAHRQRALMHADELFETALGLWRGEPYADVEASGLVADEIQRLAEQRLLLVEEAAGVGLDLGRHAELVSELQGTVKRYPFREQFTALLMLALYRSGRQSEALGTFRRARTMLRDDLGVEPGARLRRLHEAMLRADDRVLHVASSSLDGEWQPAPAAVAQVAGPAASISGTPRQLPLTVTGFVGRDEELRRLDSLLSSGTSVDVLGAKVAAITGTAGVGKTTLAVRWAHLVADQFPDGQLYINLRGFDPSGQVVSPAEAVRWFLDALAVPSQRVPTGLEAQLGLYRSVLADRRMLILLDNARDAEQARTLIPGSSACFTIVTSRDQLSGLVATEAAAAISVDVLSLAEGRALLARRFSADRSALDLEAVDSIVQLCARLPLALVVAAARAAMHPGSSLQGLAADLRDAHSGLDVLADTDRGTDVRAVFSWSYARLGAEAARLFRLLGLHPGPDVSLSAAASLAGVAPTEARRSLTELCRAHLATEREPGRFGLHDLLRAYAGDLARAYDSDAERRAAQHRVLDHYLCTAQAAGRLLDPQRSWATPPHPPAGVNMERLADHRQALAWFRTEHVVLLAVLDQASAVGFDSYVCELALAAANFLNRQGHWYQLAAVWSAALDAARRLGDLPQQARAYRNLAHAHTQLGRTDDASAQLERAVTLYRRLGDRIGQAGAHRVLASLSDRQRDYGVALEHARRALELYQAAKHHNAEAFTLNEVGWAYAMLGDYEKAVACCEQALAMLQELGDREAAAATLDSLGYAHHHLGAYQSATRCYEQALELRREFGNQEGEAETLVHLGDTQHAAGDTASARDTWRKALAILEELDHPQTTEVLAKIRSA